MQLSTRFSTLYHIHLSSYVFYSSRFRVPFSIHKHLISNATSHYCSTSHKQYSQIFRNTFHLSSSAMSTISFLDVFHWTEQAASQQDSYFKVTRELFSRFFVPLFTFVKPKGALHIAPLLFTPVCISKLFELQSTLRALRRLTYASCPSLFAVSRSLRYIRGIPFQNNSRATSTLVWVTHNLPHLRILSVWYMRGTHSKIQNTWAANFSTLH